jgi:hypothetical protein
MTLRPASLSAQTGRPKGSPRRVSVTLSLAIVAVLLLLVPMPAAATGRTAAAPAAPASNALPACTRTVSGFTAAAVDAAKNAAGAGGTVCFPAGTYNGNLTANVAGQWWLLDNNTKLTGTLNITAPKVVIYNGQFIRPNADRWMATVQIRADDAIVWHMIFRGGGAGIGVYGKDRAKILANNFRDLTGSAVSIWSENVGADDTLIYANEIIQTRTSRVSPITSRGNETNGHGGVQNLRTVVRSNSIGQGSAEVGWFGVELKQSKGALIEYNHIWGGRVLISLPESDSVTIRNNAVDLRGSATWGVEVGNAWDTVFTGNTVVGDGSKSTDYAIQMNTNPLRTIVRNNRAMNLRTLVGIAGNGHRIQDNCLNTVANVTEFMLNGGNDIIVSNNKLC